MANKRKKIVLAWLLVFSMVLPMFSSVITSKATDVTVSDENNYDAMEIEEILKLDKSLTWVFAGDSITHNATWTGNMNSYSEWFEQYLYDIGRGDDSVLLSAWGGADTPDFLTENQTPEGQGSKKDPGMGLTKMITGYNPDVVFIKLGMNDRGRTNRAFVKYYNQILDGVYAAGAQNHKIPKIILLSPTPLVNENAYDDMAHPTQDEKNYGTILRFRDEVEKIAQERNLIFCDLRTAFMEEQLRLGEDYAHTFFSDDSDGMIHPNAAGQYYIFKTLSKTLGIYDEKMPIFQLEYNDFLRQALYVDATENVTYQGEYGSTTGWEASIIENNVWAVAGANQMSGYEGTRVNRSLFRFLDNTIRAHKGETPDADCKDIRLFNLASPAYKNGVEDLLANYDKVMAIRNYDVFLLLPEIPNVYESSYVHSTEKVAEYKDNVLELLKKNDGKVKILWTPLASGDTVINRYIDDYAEVVREIVTSDSTILFFDVNKFMNDNMTVNASLVNNWFEDDSYISPLCSHDLIYAFGKLMNQERIPMKGLASHTLRNTSDSMAFKGEYVRDYVKAEAYVNGTTVTVDVSKIKEAYPEIANLRIAVMPEKGTGNYHADICDLTEIANVTEAGDVYTFEAPCADLHLAIYGEQDGLTYRFKDISLNIDTEATIPEKPAAEPDGVYLDSLKVMSAPDFGFEKNKTEYTVDLYQYQTYARVRAVAQAGLTIKVNGKTVASNAFSAPIKVEDGSKITVTVSDGKETITYTLTCVKPEQPDIIITEVMQDGYRNYTRVGSADNYELVEIYNASGRTLNLLNYSLGYKKDFTYSRVDIGNGAEYPYYFTGNDQAFGGNASYTGIKPITKYSVYWEDKKDAEPEEVLFEPDSTMVIWIKTSSYAEEADRADYNAALTYDTLKKALEENKGKYTLSVDVDGVEQAVVPQESQVVVAEVPYTQSSGLTGRKHTTLEEAKLNYVIDNFSDYYNASTPARGWLFMLKNTASPAANAAITEAGDDIISAAKFVRAAKDVNGTAQGTDKLSSVFSYNYDRGMSLVKNENVVKADKIGVGNTSDVMGYSNLTSFGAIEYWQKPTDFGDNNAPTIVNNTVHNAGRGSSVTFNFDLADDQDVRYVELYMRREGENAFTKVSKDFVLEAGVKNAGLSKDIQNVTYSYTVDNIGDQIEYYAKVVDGNNNEATVGSESEPLVITTLREVQIYSAEEALTYIGVKAPECKSEGYVFAGWYADKACEKTPIRSAEQVTETAYALFVTENVLSVKVQLSADVLSAGTSATKADLRFVTTVDTLKYKEVGFKFVIDGKETEKSTNTVYTKLYVVNAEGFVDQLTPKYFSSASNYFSAFTMTGIPTRAWDTAISATPYWITLDGITVYGTEATKTVNQGRNKNVAKIGDVYYESLATAVEAAIDNDTIEVLRSTTIDSTIVVDKKVAITNALGSSVTLTRADNLTEAMFTVADSGSLTVACAGENTITVDGNHVAATSSMVVNDGTFVLGTNANLINGTLTNGNGGALTNIGTATLSGNMSGNSAVNGGAIYNYNKGTVTINGGTVQKNTASGRGGVLYCYNVSSQVIITDGEFTDNIAKGLVGGGAISGANGTILKIEGGTFRQNVAAYENSDAWGGGVVQSNGAVTISGGIFEKNSAFNGGAIYVYTTGTLNISDGTFLDNTTHTLKNTKGGAVYYAGNTLAITGGTFKYNSASYLGGALAVDSNCKNIDISGTVFESNSIKGKLQTYNGGGALFVMGTVDGDTTVNITNCKFEKNQAEDSSGNYGFGGAIYNTHAYQLNITDTEFNGNTGRFGGTIYLNYQTKQGSADKEKSYMTLNNCSFSENTATYGPDIYVSRGYIYLKGKVVSNIVLNTAYEESRIYSNGMMAEGSTIEINVKYKTKTRVVVDFESAELMEANKGYFSLSDASDHAAYMLEFSNNQAKVVEKQ